MSQDGSQKPIGGTGWLSMAVENLRNFPPRLITAILGSFRKKPVLDEYPVPSRPNETHFNTNAPKPGLLRQKLLDIRSEFASLKERDEKIASLEQAYDNMVDLSFKRHRRADNKDTLMGDDVRREFAGVDIYINTWMHRYCNSPLETMNDVPAKEKDALIQQLEGYCIQTSWENLCKMTDPERVPWIPNLLAQAALAKEIFSGIIARPFSVLHENKENPDSFVMMAQALYEDFLTIDVPRACTWRSDTFRLLKHTRKKAIGRDYDIETRIKESCKARCIRFMNGPVRLLLRPSDLEDNSQCRKDLEAFMLMASELSFSLGTQRRHVRCHDLKDLQRAQQDEDYEYKHLRYHPYVRGKYRGSNKYLVLTRPLVRVYGREDIADGYDRSYTWKEAELYINASGPEANWT